MLLLLLLQLLLLLLLLILSVIIPPPPPPLSLQLQRTLQPPSASPFSTRIYPFDARQTCRRTLHYLNSQQKRHPLNVRRISADFLPKSCTDRILIYVGLLVQSVGLKGRFLSCSTDSSGSCTSDSSPLSKYKMMIMAYSCTALSVEASHRVLFQTSRTLR
jgi:hypothetical protein